jgi:hypothetical protein
LVQGKSKTCPPDSLKDFPQGAGIFFVLTNFRKKRGIN